jgi:Nitrate and nitrite sensing
VVDTLLSTGGAGVAAIEDADLRATASSYTALTRLTDAIALQQSLLVTAYSAGHLDSGVRDRAVAAMALEDTWRTQFEQGASPEALADYDGATRSPSVAAIEPAAVHGAEVTLTDSRFGGVAAHVLLPTRMIVTAGDRPRPSGDDAAAGAPVPWPARRPRPRPPTTRRSPRAPAMADHGGFDDAWELEAGIVRRTCSPRAAPSRPRPSTYPWRRR